MPRLMPFSATLLELELHSAMIALVSTANVSRYIRDRQMQGGSSHSCETQAHEVGLGTRSDKRVLAWCS